MSIFLGASGSMHASKLGALGFSLDGKQEKQDNLLGRIYVSALVWIVWKLATFSPLSLSAVVYGSRSLFFVLIQLDSILLILKSHCPIFLQLLSLHLPSSTLMRKLTFSRVPLFYGTCRENMRGGDSHQLTRYH
ncbi:hypothetical protein V2G26_019691 [Clonostachys chloroleuca]